MSVCESISYRTSDLKKHSPQLQIVITHLCAIPEKIHTLPFLAPFSAGVSLLLCLILLLPCGYDTRNAKHRFQCINILCGMVREPHNSPVWKYWPKNGLATTKSWNFCPSVKARTANHGFRLNQLYQAQRPSSDWAHSLCFMPSYPVVSTDFFTAYYILAFASLCLSLTQNLHVGKNKFSVWN